jgi:hypothetical protein
MLLFISKVCIDLLKEMRTKRREETTDYRDDSEERVKYATETVVKKLGEIQEPNKIRHIASVKCSKTCMNSVSEHGMA